MGFNTALLVLGVLLAFGARADSIKIGGTGTWLGTMKLMVQEFNKSRPGENLTVLPSLGSSGAIRAVVDGAIDVGVSARPLTQQEQSQGASAVARAKTPFVFATSANTKVTGLTLPELVKIYGGEVTRWSDGELIRLVVRPEADADTALLRKISADMSGAMNATLARKGLRMADTDQDNAQALEKLPGSLGTTTLAQVLSEDRAARLKVLTVDGVAPSVTSLANARYPYSKTLYLITSRNAKPATLAFVAFVRSGAGQAVLERSGSLALTE
jgi:phosphate transport system substrate-binding protein